MSDLPREKRPTDPRWREIACPPSLQENPIIVCASVWQCGDVIAISSVTMEVLVEGGELVPQWQVSVSLPGPSRSSDVDVRRVLYAFGMLGAQEDNMPNGVARQFWLPIGKSSN